jgi:sterol desaturase/sphingolipid hydroxylase (fatty acid hydroxylase superfamily)
MSWDETMLRAVAFVGVFALMAAWEQRRPWRLAARAGRWLANLVLFATGAVLVRLLLPTAATGAALVAAERDWGLLHQLHLPPLATALLSFLLLDFLIWAQHLLFHRVPWLWRLHRTHHSDTGYDCTTGLRFHPLEILLSMLIKIAAVLALGAPVVAVITFEVVLNATALFNHGNVRLPAALERWLRLVLVTPAMHRVHHSWHRRETDSNYGFNLPWWDRLFGSYVAESRDGVDGLTIGLQELREPRDGRWQALLLQPFTHPVERAA